MTVKASLAGIFCSVFCGSLLPLQTNMELLKCPHCQTTVDAKASVCAGCGAEVVRGASRRERSTAGCLSSIGGLLVSLLLVGLLPLSSSNYSQGLAVVLGFFAAVLVFNFLGRLAAGLIFRSKLRFFRDYRH